MKTLLQKAKQLYLSLHLQSKLMLTYLIIISIPMIVIAIFFYARIYNMIVADTVRMEQQESAKASPAIEQVIKDLLEDVNQIENLPFCSDYFNSHNHYTAEEIAALPSASAFSPKYREILSDSTINSVHIYVDLPDEDLTLLNNSVGLDLFQPMQYADVTYWHGIFAGTDTSSLYCPSFYLSTREVSSYGDLAYITSQPFIIDGTSYECYLAAYYSSDHLVEVLTSNLTSTENVAYIINERNSIIATTNEALSGAYFLDYSTILDSFMSSNNFLQRKVIGKEIYAGIYNIRPSQWYMVVVIPAQPLIERSRQLVTQYVLLFFGCILLALLIATFVSRSITQRISTVTAQMRKIRTSPPVPLKEPDIHDEIGDLIDTYNYMSTEMNHLLIERSQAAEELRIAEFNSLQSQINPHFLYNTMDMINWLAAQGKTEEITEAVQKLSRFYKLTLSKKETISNIAQEVEHVSIYIALQNMRFNDNIDFVVDLSDHLMEYQIPKLTLQPVVENAILHGIMEKDEKRGSIVLTGWMDGDVIELLISDDGIGISEENLKKILSGEGGSKTGSNIAIYNIHHRLQILYGEEYGLSYQSTLGKSTDVSIRFPARKTNEPFFQTNSEKHTASILQVGSDITAQAEHIISQRVLLESSEKLADNTYALRNIQQLSSQLHANDPFCIITHNVTEDFPPHKHDYFELSYVLKGSVINCIDDKKLILSAGNLVFMNRKVIQSLVKDSPNCFLINFCFWPELFEHALKNFYQDSNPISAFLHESSLSPSNFIYFSGSHDIRLQSILSSIIQEYVSSGFAHTPALDSLLMQLFSHLLQQKEYSFYGINKQTHELLQYICSHCIHDDLNTLAKELHETPHSLSAYIKKHTGRNLSDIILETKMQLAMELMNSPGRNIFQIAKECGYDNFEEFSESFQMKYKITPAEYRKQLL